MTGDRRFTIRAGVAPASLASSGAGFDSFQEAYNVTGLEITISGSETVSSKTRLDEYDEQLAERRPECRQQLVPI